MPIPSSSTLISTLSSRRRSDVTGEADERLDLLGSPLARLLGVDGKNTVHGAFWTDERRSGVTRVARGEQRVGLQQALVVPRVGDRDRASRLHRIARQPGRRRKTRLERVLVGDAARRADDQLVGLEEPQHGGIRGEELRRALHDLVEDDGRVELGCQDPRGLRELLRERALPPLGFEQAAALEGAPRRGGEVARQLEVVVGEPPRLREEDEHEAALLGARRLDRGGEQRAVAALVCNLPPAFVEAVVAGDPRRGQYAPPARGGAERIVGTAEAVFEEPDQRGGQAVQARESPVLR